MLLTNNEANLHFYESHGFAVERVGHDAARTGPRAWAMVKRLSSSRRRRSGSPTATRSRRVRAEADALENGDEGAEERRLAGRVLARRDMGKLVFLDLVDRSGRIQLLCPQARTGEVDVHLGDIVGAIGKPTKSRRGEPSLIVDELVLLARIRSPLPDTFHGLTDVEQRYRRRYLDLLMNEETRADFLLRSRMVARDPAPPRRARASSRSRRRCCSRATAARSAGRSSPITTSSSMDLYLRIATELYLKRLIVGGLERVYEIGSVFRNEGVSYKHNPEFTMLEWYEAYADYRDTMERFETLVEAVGARDDRDDEGALSAGTRST